jgi:predicted Rossmann fold nucleotide-binding protein DprA/Smf involved in DNA uptake
MQIDPEIGDTPLHVAGQAHYRILAPWEHLYPDSAITAPSQQENVLNIRKAQQAILQAVEKGPVEMVRLMKDPGLLPAAVSSALIMLKQQGKIQTQHGQVYAVNPLDAS